MKLTRHQLKIARLTADGLTAKEIAIKMNMAHGTAETHLHNIKTVMQAKNAANLVAILFRNKMID